MVKKEIVKYHNYLNFINFRGLKASEINVIFSLCAKMKEQKREKVVFTYTELKSSMFSRNMTDEELRKAIRTSAKKLSDVNGEVELPDGRIVYFDLFPVRIDNPKEQTFTIGVHEDMLFVLNDLTKNFTLFELKEFVKLSSKYSKHLYRNLKQYRTTGKYTVKTCELKQLLDIPENYANKRIKYEILNPSIKELSPYFHNLKLDTSEDETRGKPIKGYIFTFDPEPKAPSSQAEPKPKTSLLTKDGFDLGFAWRETIKIYPRQSNISSAHKTWLNIVRAEEGQEKATCTAIFNAIQRYKADYIEKNQDDTEFKYVPGFGKWLKTELDNYR